MTFKLCRACHIEKELTFFSVRRQSKDGLSSICKSCDSIRSCQWKKDNPEKAKKQRVDWVNANYEKKLDSTLSWRKKNPDKHRNIVLKSRYGITLEQYNEMLIQQENKCKICKKLFSGELIKNRPCVDHDHKCCPKGVKICGKCIRGLLCGPCNSMLGRLQEDTSSFQRAIDYVNNGGRDNVHESSY